LSNTDYESLSSVRVGYLAVANHTQIIPLLQLERILHLMPLDVTYLSSIYLRAKGQLTECHWSIPVSIPILIPVSHFQSQFTFQMWHWAL